MAKGHGDVAQDGGYHVPFAHKGLASGLHLDSYTSSLYEHLSIQSCAPQQSSPATDHRLGKLLLLNLLLLELITRFLMPISIEVALLTHVLRISLACQGVEHEYYTKHHCAQQFY